MSHFAGRLTKLPELKIDSYTGTSNTLISTDAGKLLSYSNASAITVTVPPESSVNFNVGTQILIIQAVAGDVTISAGSGVTINSLGSSLKTAGQYAIIGLIKTDSDSWIVTGSTA